MPPKLVVRSTQVLKGSIMAITVTAIKQLSHFFVESSAEGVEPRVSLLFGLLGLAELEADDVSEPPDLGLGRHLARPVLVLAFEYRPSKIMGL